MQTQIPFKMSVLSNRSKPFFFCFQFPLSKWDRGSVCDVTTKKSIELNNNVNINTNSAGHASHSNNSEL